MATSETVDYWIEIDAEVVFGVEELLIRALPLIKLPSSMQHGPVSVLLDTTKATAPRKLLPMTRDITIQFLLDVVVGRVRLL